MKRFFWPILIFLIALGVALFSERVLIRDYFRAQNQPELPEAVSFAEVKATEEDDEQPEEEALEETEESESLEEEKEEEEEAPALELTAKQRGVDDQFLSKAINLAVPFTPQAPHANWDLPYQEACEEASLYMVHAFYEGVPAGRIGSETADKELLTLVEFQKGIFGYFEDTDAAETAVIAEQFYGYGNVEVVSHPSIADIKGYLAKGMPVIIPAAGQELGNPYFTQPGPRYHMLVIRGYTEEGFITNDPGTRHGEAYVYPYAQLMHALHDWNDGDVESGLPMAIIVHPEA